MRWLRKLSLASKPVPPLRSVGDHSLSLQSKSPQAVNTLQDQGSDPRSFALSSASTPRTEDEHPPIEDPEEDVMDMSQSEADEGEITTYSPKPINTQDQQAAAYEEDEESYEPPGDINIVQQHELGLTASHLPSNSEITQHVAVTSPESTTNNKEAPLAIPVDGLTLDADMQDTEGVLQSSPSLADASDPEDYEPPEPAMLMAEPMSPLRMTRSEPVTPPLHASADVIDEVEVVHSGSPPALEYKNTSANLVGPQFEAVGSMINAAVHRVDTSTGAEVRTKSEYSTLRPLRESLEAIQVIS